jgi:DedD protein
MDQKVKERVVGAAVLAVAAVVVVPMILSGPLHRDDATSAPPIPQETRPEAGDEGFSSRIVPLGDRAVTVAGSKAAGTAPAAPAAVPSPPSDPVPETAPSSAPSARPERTSPAREAPKSTPKAAPPPSASAPRSGWVVQLGSFANPRNAYALRDRLKAKGHAAFAVSSGTGTAAVTRVYVGPEPERDLAQAHVGKLLEETRLKGIVVRYPGT